MFMKKALPDVPRRTVLAAHAVPLVTLPSALWRLALAAGLPVSEISLRHTWEVLYVVCLAVVCEGLALLTLGLVRPWGEVVPRWIPLLGGRRVRPLAATVPAVLGGVVLAGLLSWAFYSHTANIGQDGTGTPAQYALMLVCYIPLLAWPPLLIAVALAYYRRRTAAPAPAGDAPGETAAAPEVRA
ncbi:hypothetical protein [Streptomyces sp. DH24]|uniref:hypothetical protein n=1 Tax=Streptomyces sp. DH24 TaxID=3040123 RepID=UPI002441B8B8|nr:hypothetical protein [Streptomyces sp. DH24]MDG9720250.1 hypothetical protein [Streptomyces sp. DH24]